MTTRRLHHTLWRQTRARARLVGALSAGLVLYAAWPEAWGLSTISRALLAWNASVMVYLLLLLRLMATASIATMRERAYRQDEGQKTILLLTTLAVLASLAAIVMELSQIKTLAGPQRLLPLVITGLTVASSWCFMHLMFALHYAHEYYLSQRRGQPPGLLFPGQDEPDYADFAYFSAVIGTSGQTADVSLTTRAMRRTGLVHCVLAYFYNTTVLALTINIAASLMS